LDLYATPLKFILMLDVTFTTERVMRSFLSKLLAWAGSQLFLI